MISRILLLLLLLAVLGGCSSGGGEARTAPTARPAVGTSSHSIKVLQSLPGRLLYVRDNQIWVHQGDDARPLQIEGPARDPAWSSDGRRIAYIRRDESFSDLYILDQATGKTTQVTFNGRSDAKPRSRPYVHQVIWAAKPAWSPEDDEIIFLSQEQGATTEDAQPPIYEYPLSLYRFPTALFGAREPLNSDMLQVGQQNSDILSPAWSPDGRYLAYVEAPRDTTPRRIMLYDFTTEQAGRYPGIPDGAYDPAWSPDSSQLAFAAPQDGATDIWTIAAPPSNGTPRRVTNVGRARAPAWSPDGRSLAFLNIGDESTDVFVVNFTDDASRLTPGEPVAATEGAHIDATAGLSWTR
ncbi:MAG TPA: DPP IV N-terminal domain-containing protein [Herpetosiphonaceae bacterium]|nr:DPP IV N-terminal domain-containing protein [Herpetosiphonaceae bacterium]